jgi:hypothetical protein
VISVARNASSHKIRSWISVNPHLIHVIPIHNLKVSVWCAMNDKRIIVVVFSSLFNDAFSVTQIIASNERVISE